MDFEKIILDSRYKADKQAYFVAEYEKIEQSRNAPKFFPNCINVIKSFTADFYTAFEEKKIKLNYQMQRAKNNEYTIRPTTSSIPFSEINLTQYSTEQNLVLYKELKEEFDKLDILTFVSSQNLLSQGFSLVELTHIEVELLKAQDLINPKYCICISFSDESPKSIYDIRIIRVRNKSLEAQFDTQNELNIFLFQKLIHYIFKSHDLEFDVEECLNYHCSNSIFSEDKFKKIICEVLDSQLNVITNKNSKVAKRAEKIKEWSGLNNNLKNQPHTASKLKKSGAVYQNLKDVAISDQHFENLLKSLKVKNIITENNTLNKSASKSEKDLYAIVKRFKNDGMFKKIFDKYLHELTNKEFKTKTSYQNWKQTSIYSKSIEQ